MAKTTTKKRSTTTKRTARKTTAKSPTRKTGKKSSTTAKKTTAKKTSKKTSTKTPKKVTKKTVRKPGTTVKKTTAKKKTTARKSTAKKTTAKKTTTKRTTGKKTAVKKPAVKKTVGKKTTAKKEVKKTTAKKKTSGVTKPSAKVSSPPAVIKKKAPIKRISLKRSTMIRPEKPEGPKIKKYKPNKKKRYTKRELERFKKIILEERNKIIQSAKANMQSLVDDESEYVGDNLTYASHMAEQGTDEMEREKNYMFVQRDEKYLGYLQDALVRIDQGTYGVCIDCIDTPHNYCKTCPLIDGERLELVPITQHCIECKNIRG